MILNFNKIKDISHILLNEVLESYRHHVYKLKHLKSIYSEVDDGSVCPVCEGVISKYYNDINYLHYCTVLTCSNVSAFSEVIFPVK